MSKMEYMPVDCLQVPKMLFQMEKYKNLSNTAKILYSLFLDRLKFAVQNGWVDHNGDLFVIYPKSEMKKDLNTTRYGVDQAVQELGIGRTSFYKMKKQALGYLGFYFYEIVVPQAKDKRFKPSLGVEEE